uniref:Short myomegalin-like EB1 binding protein N-terminal domain-containing protein n=1 Tax=Oreochromis aureus TaxID=47969 RepID=A0AAZ1XTQ8_OREAU
MKEVCRICGRELCGNQRKWIFHPAAKLNLHVLLSYAVGRELTRDGRGEFACSKCTFMLDRMYRFDTVIARVEALSIERLQRLLQEKHRLRQCISGLYRKTNSDEGAVTLSGSDDGPGDGMVDISGLTHAKYCALLQEDLVYSLYESWADDSSQRCAPSTPRRCRGCSYWRVADSDYEAVCKVPRKLARSISCGPSTRYSASVVGGSLTGGGDPSRTSDSDRTLAGRASSSPSIASLEAAEEYIQPGAITDGPLSSPVDAIEDQISDSLSEEHMGAPLGQASPRRTFSLALSLLQSCAVYRPVRSTKGSKLPVLLRRSSSNGGTRLVDTGLDQDLNLADMEKLFEDLYKEYPPPPPHQVQNLDRNGDVGEKKNFITAERRRLKLQEKLSEMECELRSLRQASQSQERTIQGLTESLSTKDNEAQELYLLIEGQNTTLCKLQEIAHRSQLAQTGVSESLVLAQLQGELVGVQSSLFSLGLELEASQRSLRQSQRQADDLMRFKERLNSDLQEALQHREVTEKHNQVSLVVTV